MASSPRQGRAGSSSSSPRLGSRDPRLRSNANGAVSDAELAPGSLERDAAGRTRFSGFDAIQPLSPAATLAQAVAQLNLMLARGKGG